MKEYISREVAILETRNPCLTDEQLRRRVALIPVADVVEVVRCKDCKHRIVNKHFGEKGYMQVKAMCKLDTGDPFELGRNAGDDNWFCADGERKDGGMAE